MNYYKFSDTDSEPLKINDELTFLKDKLSNKFGFGYDNLTSQGVYKEMGWIYDFRDELTKYIVKTDYYLQEIYHLNKTLLRKQLTGLGKIHYIKEI